MPRCTIEVYLTPQQKELLAQKAALSQQTLSAYARDKLLSGDVGLDESLKRIERLCATAVASAIVSTSPSNATPQANRDRALELIRHSVRAAHRVIETMDSVEPGAGPGAQP